MATFFNQATLRYNGNTINSNIVTGELVEVLSVTKTAIPETYGQGDSITYLINIVNSGATAMTGLTVTDDLGTYLFGTGTLTPLTYVDGSVRYYSGGVLQPTPTVTAGPPLAVTGITVPAGGNALIAYRATVNSLAPLAAGATVTNTATVTGGGISAPLTATATVTAESAPALTISKAICPATVIENGQITYTFVIQNTGNIPVVATDDLTVTDTFDPILTNITVTYNDVPLALGTGYTYDTATGQFATLPGQITVPAATYTQDPVTGEYTVTPGVGVLRVVGTV